MFLQDSDGDPPAPPVISAALLGPAIATIVAAYVPAGVTALWLGFGIGALITVYAIRRGLVRRLTRPASAWSVVAVVLLLGLCLAPAFRLAVAPGADQAMYSAIARGIGDGSAGLSPAYGDLAPAFYPRGYPLLLATLAPLVGVAKASLWGSGLALAGYAAALGFFLAALGLGRHSLPCAVALTLLCRVPQEFHAFGSGATTMGLGLGLLAGGHLVLAGRGERVSWRHLGFAALFAMAGLAAHPIGSSATTGLGVLVLVVQQRPSRWLRVAPVALAMMVFGVVMLKGGPVVSAREAVWIKNWVRGPDALFLSWPITVGGTLQAMEARFGTPALTLFLSGIVVGLGFRRTRGLSLLALAAGVGFWGLEALGPNTPVLRTLVYPNRLSPALAIAMALPVLVLHRSLRPGVQQWVLAILLAAAVASNLRYYQSATPMASAADLEAIACLDREVRAGEAIDGAYGDATQWIPALTGREVAAPHVHISLEDEFRAARAARPVTIGTRFVGEVQRYASQPIDSSDGTPFCRTGGARGLRLSTPIVVDR